MTTPDPISCNDCGRTPEVYQRVNARPQYYMRCCTVGCGKRSKIGPKCDTQDEAAQKWNNQERWDGVEPIPEDSEGALKLAALHDENNLLHIEKSQCIDDIQKLTKALKEIKATSGWQTGPVSGILSRIRRLANEALGDA